MSYQEMGPEFLKHREGAREGQHWLLNWMLTTQRWPMTTLEGLGGSDVVAGPLWTSSQNCLQSYAWEYCTQRLFLEGPASILLVPECDMGHSHDQHLPRKWRSSQRPGLAHFFLLMMCASCWVFPSQLYWERRMIINYIRIPALQLQAGQLWASCFNPLCCALVSSSGS